MNFTFENQGTNTYLVYTTSAGDVIDTMSLGMLANNNIPGLSKTVFSQINDQYYIKYNVSAKISAKQFLSGAVNKKRLLGVFSGVVNAMLSAEEYMIDINSILLDLDYMFSDVVTCDTFLICLPITNNIKQPDPGTFFRNVMFNTQFDQTENCDYVAQIINYLNSTPVFSLESFGEILKNLSASPNAKKEFANPSSEKNIAPNPYPQVQQTPPAPVSFTPAQTPSGNAPLKSPQNTVANNNMAIPPKPIPPAAATPAPVGPSAPAGEKKMSFFYLLQHYNKENVSKYKMQKAQKGQRSDAPQKSAAADSSFAIPGQDIPVQQPAPPANHERPAAPVYNSAAQPVNGANRPPFPTAPQQPAPVVPHSPNDLNAPSNYSNNIVPNNMPEEYADDGETMILGAGAPAQQLSPHLLRKRTNQKLFLNKPVIRIGRDAGFNDYPIENKYIGHSHCHIITRNGEFFIVDDNSKNHTYVDDALITSGTEVKLAHGKIIKMANEEFEFKMF